MSDIGHKSRENCGSPAKRGRPKKDPDIVLKEKEEELRIRDQKIRELLDRAVPSLKVTKFHDEAFGTVSGEAIATLVSSIPKGKVATISRIKNTLISIYSNYYDVSFINADEHWFGYSDCGTAGMYYLNRQALRD